MITTWTKIALVVAGSASFGCATVPPPPGTATGAVSSIRVAEELGARRDPRSAIYLQIAQEGVERAKTLEAKGEHNQAKAAWMRAQVDGELAIAVARESQERAQTRAAMEKLKAYKETK